MAKEFFKNLPDTSTPLNASRLNGLLNGSEAMGNIVVGDVKCKNLFNKDDVLDNYYLNNGELVIDSSMCTNNSYIEVEPNKNYVFSCNTSSTMFIDEYDENKNFIGHITEWEKTEIAFTTTTTTKYIRTSITKTSKDRAQIEEGTTATEYTPAKSFGYTSGSNENGSWIKYDDGTMICHGAMPITAKINNPRGSGFYGSAITFKNYAQSFVEEPRVFLNNNNANWVLISHIEKNKEQILSIVLSDFAAYDNETTFNNDYIAIRRWKKKGEIKSE